MLSNRVAAISMTIEFVGFGLLAYELNKTNKSAIVEAKGYQEQRSDFESIVISEPNKKGEKGSSSIAGGLIRDLIKNMKAREADLERSRALIVRGIQVTAAGAFLQVLGSFGQAWYS